MAQTMLNGGANWLHRVPSEAKKKQHGVVRVVVYIGSTAAGIQ